LLLEHGANVNAKDVDHWTPLHLAAENGHFELCRTLLENNADLNAQTSDGETPLHRTSVKGRVDIARLLLDRGANPRARGKVLKDGTSDVWPESLETILVDGAVISSFSLGRLIFTCALPHRASAILGVTLVYLFPGP
jgi:ankyrin repeat protein